jgi:hypothetical protein
VQDVLGPVESIINLLTTPIPGLCDLSHPVGQGDVTLYGIAGRVASVAFSQGVTVAARQPAPPLGQRLIDRGPHLAPGAGDGTAARSRPAARPPAVLARKA